MAFLKVLDIKGFYTIEHELNRQSNHQTLRRLGDLKTEMNVSNNETTLKCKPNRWRLVYLIGVLLYTKIIVLILLHNKPGSL